MSTTPNGRALLAGIGNEFRGDDAVGMLVAERIRHLKLNDVEVITLSDNLDTLLGIWCDLDLVILVDAVHSDETPGTLICFDLLHDPPPHAMSATSTHALDPLQLVRLARILNCLPHKLFLVGIEGADFAIGADVCDEVYAALPSAVERITTLFREAGFGYNRE